MPRSRAEEAGERFCREVLATAALPSGKDADETVRAVVEALAARPVGRPVLDLARALPAALRPTAVLGAAARHRPEAAFGSAEFLRRVGAALRVPQPLAVQSARAVFAALQRRLAAHQIEALAAELPRDFGELWQSARWSPGPAPREEEAARLSGELANGLDLGALPPGVSAAAVVSAVLCVLSQRLAPREARDLAVLLPAEGQALLRPCLAHRDEPAGVFGREELLQRLAEHIGLPSTRDAELVVRAVFARLRARMTKAAIDHVAAELPRDLGQLWAAEPPARVRLPEDEATRAFLRQIETSGAMPPGVTPQEAASEVLCALAARLSGGEARDLALSLPPSLQPLVRACALSRGEAPRVFGAEEFVHRIAERLHIPRAQARALARAVFGAAQAYLPPEEIEDISSQLPKDLDHLWRLTPEPPPPLPELPLENVDRVERDVRAFPFLRDIEELARVPRGLRTAEAAAVVICALCERLSAGEARHLVALLPAVFRPLVEPCAERRAGATPPFGKDQLVRRVAAHLSVEPEDAEELARAVFAAVRLRLSLKEAHDVASQLPRELKELWGARGG